MDMKKKFLDPFTTGDGSTRAYVDLTNLKTLWFNTGSRCNLECENCYIESSPRNDRLEYISAEEVVSYLDEVRTLSQPVELIGLTGGEPFLNPHIIDIISEGLKRDFDVLVLSNAFNVINRKKDDLVKLKDSYGDKLHLRISLDHHAKEFHEKERGEGTFDKTLENIQWFHKQGFNVSLAGRSLQDEDLAQATQSYRELLASYDIDIHLEEGKLVVFPEMDTNREVPEITTKCWDILNKSPEQQMCATERMIVKRKGDELPTIVPCTLLAYDKQFDLGHKLDTAQKRVQLNHKFCAQFCVLGGASCSSAK